MATEITMPKLSDTMEEGTILKWHVAEGDRVSRGDIIAEVETDKAAMEMEAFDDGVVTAIKVPDGETVAVGTVIAILDGAAPAKGGKERKEMPAAGAKEKETARQEPEEVAASAAEKETGGAAAGPAQQAEQEAGEMAEAQEPPEGQERKTPEAEAPERSRSADQAGRGVRPGGLVSPASPAARRLAEAAGIDLSRVRGTGPGGRVVVADVEQARAEKGGVSAGAVRAEEDGEKGGKSVKIRRIVARKMIEAWETIPHFYVTVAVDMTDVIRFRKDLKVSINDFIVAATARSLREHPWVNSHFIDGEAVEQAAINIAMAVATDRGLYNPVLKDCAERDLRDISRSSLELAERAHQGKLSQKDMQDGTFTISNMGMLGVESFSAIITPPQVAVLAVGTARGELVVDEHGESTIAPILRLTLSADHRALDGADAAEFLATLKSYLEAPVVLIAGDNPRESK
jgi:pyruvate dehydrogenase E2 component (dihydrolipoyllysine-residue acetyltransferase)